MNPVLSTIALLVVSNIFMTYAWYGHLKNLPGKPLVVVILASWGVALFEYVFQVPANRIGFRQLELPQLKMLNEVITLSVFVPFSVYYMRQPIRTDFLWAALCLCGAVYFMFRGGDLPLKPAPGASLNSAEGQGQQQQAKNGQRDRRVEPITLAEKRHDRDRNA